MKLGEVAKVRSGLVLSRKMGNAGSGIRYRLLNLKSIHPDGYIDMEKLDIYPASEILSPDYLTHVGDLVVRLSTPYTAVLIDKSTEGLLISSYFVIIRCNPQKLLPGYLFWLLNTGGIRRSIYENSTSNMLNAVNAKYFTEFLVKPLSIESQRKISDMNLLSKRECFLLNELAKQKEIYCQAKLAQYQKMMKRGYEYDKQK